MGIGNSRPSLEHCILWKADRSPACRAVLMALDAMNINVCEIDVNLDAGEHRSAEITAMNPRQTLPILKDKDLILSDSNAIATYMASRYGGAGANTLLPTEPACRALVEQYMHFNSSVLYPQYKAASNPILYQDSRVIAMPIFCEIHCAYYDMENMLKDRQWFNSSNSDWPSLADIMIAATVSTLHILVPIQKRKYPKLAAWLSRISERNYYITANKKGLDEFAKRINVGETVKEPKKVVKVDHKEPPFHQQDINPGDSNAVTKPIKYRESHPGDNNEKQKPVKYRGCTIKVKSKCCSPRPSGKSCYLADLPDLRKAEKKAPACENEDDTNDRHVLQSNL